jgi:DivIVA domain-containing protein
MSYSSGRLTARDLIAKSFSAKSRRGYDPAEVDAYLMEVARQVDELNLEIDRLQSEVARLQFAAQAAPAPAPASSAAPMPAPAADFTSPPPPAAPAPAPIAAAPAEFDDEALRLMFKAAQQTAQQTISDAKARGEEILAEARYRSAESGRESDRKAFEAASRIQGEIVQLEQQVRTRQLELDELARLGDVERLKVREMAYALLRTVGDETVEHDVTPASNTGPTGREMPAPPQGDAIDLRLPEPIVVSAEHLVDMTEVSVGSMPPAPTDIDLREVVPLDFETPAVSHSGMREF